MNVMYLDYKYILVLPTFFGSSASLHTLLTVVFFSYSIVDLPLGICRHFGILVAPARMKKGHKHAILAFTKPNQKFRKTN